MRSIWRVLALQWLGGDGSEALTGDSPMLEGLLRGREEWRMRTFDVRREPQVSHRAIMAPGTLSGAEGGFDPEGGKEGALHPTQTDLPSH